MLTNALRIGVMFASNFPRLMTSVVRKFVFFCSSKHDLLAHMHSQQPTNVLKSYGDIKVLHSRRILYIWVKGLGFQGT